VASGFIIYYYFCYKMLAPVFFLPFCSLSNWLRDGRPRSRSSSPGRGKNFLFSTSSWLATGSTQPPIQWLRWVLSPGLKQLGRESDHSIPSIAEVKNMWSVRPLPIVLH
jgi:hypothetical protein